MYDNRGFYPNEEGEKKNQIRNIILKIPRKQNSDVSDVVT